MIKTHFVLSLILLLLSRLLVAAPSTSVFHAHAGRIHQHPLPAQGLAHRHGGGEPGVAVKSTNGSPVRNPAAVIRSAVNYPALDRKPVTKNRPFYHMFDQNHTRKPKTVPSGENSSTIHSDSFQVRQSLPASPLRYTKADIRCRTAQADCNSCAANVRQQFQKAASGQISWRSKPWRFNWPQQYPPFGKRPLDIFDGDPAYALGIPDKHVQGFVRTNSSRFPYAGTHSHKRQGGVFVIRQQADGKKYLSSLYPAHSRHPSGAAVLGNYLVYGEQGRIYFRDINNPARKQAIALPLPNANFGGGLGAVKLSKDNYLFVTTGPGGQDGRKRFNQFYQLQGQNSHPKRLKFIGKSVFTKPPQWSKGFGFSENLSLIKECGTGDIYAIHTTGDEKGIRAINGNGYWRLSKLVNQGGLKLQPVNAFTTRQNMSSCNVRAAATVFVNRQHKLEFYCHGYAKDPDGSTFNVLGPSSRGADKFYFRAGVVR